jgi:hypothetical protein
VPQWQFRPWPCALAQAGAFGRPNPIGARSLWPSVALGPAGTVTYMPLHQKLEGETRKGQLTGEVFRWWNNGGVDGEEVAWGRIRLRGEAPKLHKEVADMRYMGKRHTSDEELGKGRSPTVGSWGLHDASGRVEGTVPIGET